MKISAKKINMQHAERIGFLTGLHVQLVAPDSYAKDVNKKALVDCRCIEIKKRTICEKGIASKMLMVCTFIH